MIVSACGKVGRGPKLASKLSCSFAYSFTELLWLLLYINNINMVDQKMGRFKAIKRKVFVKNRKEKLR